MPKPQMDNEMGGVKKLSDTGIPPASAPLIGGGPVNPASGLGGSLGTAKRHLAKQESGKFHKTRGM